MTVSTATVYAALTAFLVGLILGYVLSAQPGDGITAVIILAMLLLIGFAAGHYIRSQADE